MTKLKHLNLEISNPCNERCVHCYRTCKQTKRGFLSIENVQKIFNDLKQIREEKINVLLTGGEVLLNKEWRKIILYSMGQNARVSLFTNGTLMSKDDIQFLSELNDNPNFKEVQISLYSLKSEVHDSITGLNGSCKKSFKAINALKSAGVKIFISCPVMKENLDSIADLMRYMDRNGIGSCANPYIFPNSDYEGRNTEHRLSVEDLETFYAETSNNNFQLGYVWGYNQKKENIYNQLFYGSAANGILVSGDGNIYPMIGWYEKLGNIHEDSIKEVFLSHPLLERCRQIKIGDFAECRKCNDIGYCSFCPTTHLTANNGKIGKLNSDYCGFVHLVRQMAERRDAAKTKLK